MEDLPAGSPPNPPEKPGELEASGNLERVAQKEPIHPLHELSGWFATCWADPPRALRQLERGLKGIKHGHWIKTAIGICVFCGIIWWLFFRPPEGTSYSANNNANSDIIQGSPNAVIDKSVHNEAQPPTAGIVSSLSPVEKIPQFLSLGGTRFFFASPDGVVFTDMGEPILVAKMNGYRLLLSAEIRDKNGDLIAELIDNEWKLNPGLIFDRNYSNVAVEVRDRSGEIVLQVVSCGQIVRFEGIFHLKNGRTFSVGKDASGETIFSFEPNLIKIDRIFTYPSDLHLGECPGYDRVVKSEPAIVPGQTFGYGISHPIEVGLTPTSSALDKSVSPH